MAARPEPRLVVDAEGVSWGVSEAYRLGDGSLGGRSRGLSVLWFETASGRTASALITPGSLGELTDAELLRLLAQGTARQGRQP